MTKELACAQVGNDLCIGELACQPEAVIVIAEEAQRFVPERTCHLETNCHTCSKCSECGHHVWHVYNYCPNCGAKVIDKVVEE